MNKEASQRQALNQFLLDSFAQEVATRHSDLLLTLGTNKSISTKKATKEVDRASKALKEVYLLPLCPKFLLRLASSTSSNSDSSVPSLIFAISPSQQVL